jgi:hypothetical protein
LHTQCNPEQLEFQGFGTRKVVADFSGGRITSDAGGLLLREVETGTGILRKFAECFADYRHQLLVEHSVPDLVAQNSVTGTFVVLCLGRRNQDPPYVGPGCPCYPPSNELAGFRND